MIFGDDEQISIITGLYPEMVDETITNESDSRVAMAMTEIRLIQKHFQSPSLLLDIGCSTGSLLDAAKHAGIDQPIGIEPSRWAAASARQKGHEVFQGYYPNAIENIKLVFDVIVANDVIEHVRDPQKLISSAHRHLRSGGIIVLATPDISSLTARLLGNRWWHFRPGHVHYFTINTLTLLLEKNDFEIKHIERPSWRFTIGYFIERVIAFSGLRLSLDPKSNLMRKILKDTSISVNTLDSVKIVARKS